MWQHRLSQYNTRPARLIGNQDQDHSVQDQDQDRFFGLRPVLSTVSDHITAFSTTTGWHKCHSVTKTCHPVTEIFGPLGEKLFLCAAFNNIYISYHQLSVACRPMYCSHFATVRRTTSCSPDLIIDCERQYSTAAISLINIAIGVIIRVNNMPFSFSVNHACAT